MKRASALDGRRLRREIVELVENKLLKSICKLERIEVKLVRSGGCE